MERYKFFDVNYEIITEAEFASDAAAISARPVGCAEIQKESKLFKADGEPCFELVWFG